MKCSASVEQGETEAEPQEQPHSLAAYSSGGVKPASQNTGFWPEDTFNGKML